MQRLLLKSVTMLALCICSLQLSAAESPDIDIPYQRFVLDNGLTLIVHEDRKAPIVAVSVWYHVGSKDEPKGKSGFAHLFEHLMFNGSENYDDEFFKPLEQVGATAMNGTTWFDRTNYFQNVPTPALDMTLWLESDRMGHLLGAVTQEKLDNQIGVVQNEKRRFDNQPYSQVWYAKLEGLFPAEHPYRHSVIGSMDDLSNASLDDVHQWFKHYYGAANTVLVLAGDIDAETALAKVEKYFGDIPSGPPLARLTSMVPERSADTFEVAYEAVPQIQTSRFWVMPGRSTHEAAMMSLTASILGSGKNSRLYQALVYENPLAVTVDVSIDDNELASTFEIAVTLKPDASLEEVNTILDKEIAEFLENGPSAKELERAQTKINASLIRGLEAIGGFGGKAVTLAEGELYAGDPGFYQTRLDWMNEATQTDIQTTARRWISNGRYQMDVFPYGDYKVTESEVDRSTGLPIVGSLPDLIFPEVQRGKLKNGMDVVLAQRSSVPIVNVALQFEAGYAADMFATPGTSSFALSMMDEGTGTRSALEISEQSEMLGAEISTSSNLDTSSVSLNALKSKLKPSLELLADIVRNPEFHEGELERLKARWLPTIEQEKNNPRQLANRILPSLIYGKDHAYSGSFTGSGTSESIAALSQADLKKFHSTWIRPSNGTVFVVGDTSMDEIIPMLNDAFGNWKENRMALPQKNLKKVALPGSGKVFIINKPGAPQSTVLAGHIAPPTAVENNADISTMNDIIGGSFTARVNMNLREDKGWSYGSYTYLKSARGQRAWLSQLEVQTDKTSESIEEVIREFNEYQTTNPATQDELNKSVRNTVNSLPGQFETSAAVLGQLMSQQRYGRPDDYVLTIKTTYEAIDLESVQSAADEVIHPDKMVWLIVGDQEQIEAKVAELGLGEITILDDNGNPVE